MTFTVTTGGLSMTAPASADLGSGAPGTTITGNLGGNVLVTDLRATLGGTWTATASSTAWTTGTGTADETIPAADATYTPGAITTTGTITATGHNHHAVRHPADGRHRHRHREQHRGVGSHHRRGRARGGGRRAPTRDPDSVGGLEPARTRAVPHPGRPGSG